MRLMAHGSREVALFPWWLLRVGERRVFRVSEYRGLPLYMYNIYTPDFHYFGKEPLLRQGIFNTNTKQRCFLAVGGSRVRSLLHRQSCSEKTAVFNHPTRWGPPVVFLALQTPRKHPLTIAYYSYIYQKNHSSVASWFINPTV